MTRDQFLREKDDSQVERLVVVNKSHARVCLRPGASDGASLSPGSSFAPDAAGSAPGAAGSAEARLQALGFRAAATLQELTTAARALTPSVPHSRARARSRG